MQIDSQGRLHCLKLTATHWASFKTKRCFLLSQSQKWGWLFYLVNNMVLFSVIDQMRDDYLYGAIATEGTLKIHNADSLAEKYNLPLNEVQDIIAEYKWDNIYEKIWGKRK